MVTEEERREAQRSRREYAEARRAQQPRFRDAAVADAALTARRRGEPFPTGSRWSMVRAMVRLAVVSDAYLAQLCYRAKVDLQVRGVPVLPRLLHHVAMSSAQVSIGDPVLIEAGVYLPHGQVVIDGMVEVGAETAISPWVTIGLLTGGYKGPAIGRDVRIGTGAKVLGPVVIGDGARIGANAVVLDDVPAGATAVGVPARVVPSSVAVAP